MTRRDLVSLALTIGGAILIIAAIDASGIGAWLAGFSDSTFWTLLPWGSIALIWIVLVVQLRRRSAATDREGTR
jgi:hypothetical protein